MKKFLAVFSIVCLVASNCYASNIGLESLWNNVYDSTNEAIQAVIGGDATLKTIVVDTATIRMLEVTGDSTFVSISSDTVTTDTLGINYGGGVVRVLTVTADTNGTGYTMIDGKDTLINAHYNDSDTEIRGDDEIVFGVDAGTNSAEWHSGNVTYLGLNEDIETAIAAATAGDTIVLAAGTYTITDDIDIVQAITLQGQGQGKTIITCSTASKNNIDISANCLIKNLSIVVTGAASTGITSTGGTSIIKDVTITSNASTGVSYAYTFINSNNTMDNVTIVSGSGDDAGRSGYVQSTGAGTFNNYFRNCKMTNTANGATSYNIAIFAATGTVNVYVDNNVLKNSGSTNNYSIYTGAGAALANFFVTNSNLNGGNIDVNNSSGVITLYDTTLVNGTISGTIAVSNFNIISSDTTSSIGGAVGRMSIISSDGTVCYVPIYAAS